MTGHQHSFTVANQSETRRAMKQWTFVVVVYDGQMCIQHYSWNMSSDIEMTGMMLFVICSNAGESSHAGLCDGIFQ